MGACQVQLPSNNTHQRRSWDSIDQFNQDISLIHLVEITSYSERVGHFKR